MFSSEVLSFSSISTSSSRDYTQLPMESLLKLKRTYINRFEYEKAKKVQTIINERKVEDINGVIQECIEKINQKIDEIENDLQRKRESIMIQYKFKELDISEKIDNAFQILRDRHLDELAAIEKQKALGYVRAIHKPIKESRELLAQSKRLAENDDFDGAVKIREKSRKVKEEIIQARKDQVNQKYENMRKQFYSKQKNDLQILSEKLNAALNKNEAEKMEALKAQDKLAKNTIVFHQQKILGEMTQKLKSKDNKLELLDQINKFLNPRINKFNEMVEQANNEAMKSQTSTAQTSVVDFVISGEGNVTSTVEEEEESNINSDNQSIDLNIVDNINNNNDEFQIDNDDNIESNPIDDFQDANIDDIANQENNEDIQNDENIVGNDFDAVDNNLQLNSDLNEEQNYEEDQMINNNEEDEVFIDDNQPDEIQQCNEEEAVISDQCNPEDGNNYNISVEEEVYQDMDQDENLNDINDLSADAIENANQNESYNEVLSENNDDLVPGSPDFNNLKQLEQDSSDQIKDIIGNNSNNNDEL